jgi:hypothetical protein
VITTASAAIALFALTGSDTDDDAVVIESAISRAMTSTDPAICDELFTGRWLDDNFASDTQSAIDRCREATAEDPARKADSVSVSEVSVDGGRALATAQVSGGNVGAATLKLVLVHSDDWRIDELAEIAIERDRFFAAQRQVIDSSRLPSEVSALMRCTVGYAESKVSTAEIEKSLLAGNESFYAGAYERCRHQFRAFFFSPAIIGAKTDFSEAELRCVSRVASVAFDDDQLKKLYVAFAKQQEPPSSLSAKGNAVVRRCAA